MGDESPPLKTPNHFVLPEHDEPVGPLTIDMEHLNAASALQDQAHRSGAQDALEIARQAAAAYASGAGLHQPPLSHLHYAADSLSTMSALRDALASSKQPLGLGSEGQHGLPFSATSTAWPSPSFTSLDAIHLSAPGLDYATALRDRSL